MGFSIINLWGRVSQAHSPYFLYTHIASKEKMANARLKE